MTSTTMAITLLILMTILLAAVLIMLCKIDETVGIIDATVWEMSKAWKSVEQCADNALQEGEDDIRKRGDNDNPKNLGRDRVCR